MVNFGGIQMGKIGVQTEICQRQTIISTFSLRMFSMFKFKISDVRENFKLFRQVVSGSAYAASRGGVMPFPSRSLAPARGRIGRVYRPTDHPTSNEVPLSMSGPGPVLV